jgi:hypothetical protein
MRRWLVRIAVAVGLPVAGALLVAMAVAYPYVRDDLSLDRIVRAVALDWRDFGRETAENRLQYELDHQGIGLAVGDDSCSLREQEGARVVACSWKVDVAFPTGHVVPLSFSSVAELAADGDLR